MRLLTPLGEIAILIDGNTIEYDCRKIDINTCCEDVSGRYAIQISFKPDGMELIQQ